MQDARTSREVDRQGTRSPRTHQGAARSVPKRTAKIGSKKDFFFLCLDRSDLQRAISLFFFFYCLTPIGELATWQEKKTIVAIGSELASAIDQGRIDQQQQRRPRAGPGRPRLFFL
jgi:hypothetical protein